jgi:hypothetical protein
MVYFLRLVDVDKDSLLSHQTSHVHDCFLPSAEMKCKLQPFTFSSCEWKGLMLKHASKHDHHGMRMKELHEGRHMKIGERREVVDRTSQKGLPSIRFDKTTFPKQPIPWPRAHDD